jgi:hypothetical protein
MLYNKKISDLPKRKPPAKKEGRQTNNPNRRLHYDYPRKYQVGKISSIEG